MHDSFDTILTTSDAVAATMLNDRRAGHRMTMSLWGNIELPAHQGARSRVGCLWSVLAVDPVQGTGTVLVRSTVAPENHATWAASQTTSPTQCPEPGETVRFHAHIAAMYTPRSDVPLEWRAQLKEGANGTPRAPGQGLSYRSRQVPVPIERLDAWAAARLQRLGIDAEVAASPRSPVDLKGTRTHTAHIDATATEVDGRVSELLRTGLGKGRAYGLGAVVWG